MLISERLYEKVFESKDIKSAYLKCCKWVSTNILAVNNSNNITYRIEKVESRLWIGKVKLTVYVSADEQEINDNNCKICRETHSLFYLSENKHKCESCKVIPYRKRMQDKLKLIAEGIKKKYERESQ